MGGSGGFITDADAVNRNKLFSLCSTCLAKFVGDNSFVRHIIHDCKILLFKCNYFYTLENERNKVRFSLYLRTQNYFLIHLKS